MQLGTKVPLDREWPALHSTTSTADTRACDGQDIAKGLGSLEWSWENSLWLEVRKSHLGGSGEQRKAS